MINLSRHSKYVVALALAALLSPVAARAAGESGTASSPAKAKLVLGILIKNTLTAPVTLVLTLTVDPTDAFGDYT